MVKFDFRGQQFYIDGYIKANMDILKAEIQGDNDVVVIVDGRERSGKSHDAQIMAAYVDPTFDFDRIAFTSEEFKKVVINAPKKCAVIWDEALAGVRAANWASEVNKAVIQLLSEIGQKNLFIFIVMPSFFEVARYIALHRSEALIHAYRNEGQKGFVMAFNYSKKKILYLLGRKGYNYNVIKSNFFARFLQNKEFEYPLDVIEKGRYRQMKLDALKAQEAEPQKKLDKREAKVIEQRDKAISKMHELGLTMEEIAQIVGLSDTRVQQVTKISHP